MAPGLKSIDDATEIRRRILIAFEAAEREAVPELPAEWMMFVVVGGGPTGVELAGALGEIAFDTLKRDFRSHRSRDGDPSTRRGDATGSSPTYPPSLSASAQRQLERLGRRWSAPGPWSSASATTGWSCARRRRPTPSLSASGRGRCSGPRASRRRRSGGSWRMPSAPRRIERAGCGRAGPHRPGSSGDLRDRRRGGAAVEVRSAGAGRGTGRHPGAGSTPRRPMRRRLDGEPVRAFRYQDRGDVAVIGRLAGVTNIGWLGRSGARAGSSRGRCG